MSKYPIIRLSSIDVNKRFYVAAGFEGPGIEQLIIYYGTLNGSRVKEPDVIFSLTRKKELSFVELKVTNVTTNESTKHYLSRTSTIDNFIDTDRKHIHDLLKVWLKLDFKPLNEPFRDWFNDLYPKDYHFLMPYLEAILPLKN